MESRKDSKPEIKGPSWSLSLIAAIVFAVFFVAAMLSFLANAATMLYIVSA